VKRRIAIIVAVLLIAAAAAGAAYWYTRPTQQVQQLTLYGNVDLRQVDLAFNGSERIAAVLVQEGDVVHKGQVLAKMDTSRLQPQFDNARAQAAAQKAVVQRFHNGSRPEEIAQARANLASAQADAENSQLLYGREKALFDKGSATQQDLDNAKAAMDVANAKVEVNRKALDLEIGAPRTSPRRRRNCAPTRRNWRWRGNNWRTRPWSRRLTASSARA
jgi:HlyD family secretion protein